MDLTAAVAQGTVHPLLLAATALLLGALHGLEPGHAKTMMAAFIIAVRGTVGQAVVLGLSAAVSHTVIVWVLAILALRYGEALIGDRMEAWFLVASGGIVLAIAAWMLAGARKANRARRGAAPAHAPPGGRALSDAHARAHARAIGARFADRRAGTLQTVLFGLSGGLIPCSAAIAVLLLCLQVDRVWLGLGLVGAFSAGLAATLVAAGVAAALGLRHVSVRTRRLDRVLAGAPYVSAAIVAAIGGIMLHGGRRHL